MLLRCVCFIFLLLLGVGAQAETAASGRVMKVLPMFLDLRGRTATSPSLLDRDAYQAQLRAKPALRSGVEFAIHWRGRAPKNPSLLLRVEIRGGQPGELPTRQVIEQRIKPKGGPLGTWTSVKLVGDDYRRVGEITSWRVSLWDGARLLGEQKSFLWESGLPEAPFTNAPAVLPPE